MATGRRVSEGVTAGTRPGGRPAAPEVDGLARVLVAVPPEYGALVMATGIVAFACAGIGLRAVALALTWLNVVMFLVLACVFAARLALARRRTSQEFVDHARGPGYFTWVAATCVLASQVATFLGAANVARALLAVAAAAWVGITYGFFAAVTLRRAKPRLEAALSGSWLLAVVATQAVALLAVQVGGEGLAVVRAGGADQSGMGADLVFGGLCLFLAGTVLYLLIIGLIFYRFTFLRIEASQLAAPYWINMGALAITTLTGATLLTEPGPEPLWSSVRPFLLGFTLLFWAFGSWWIPLLVVFGAWRHLVAKYPLRYAPEYWGLVFPLGMYGVASRQLAAHVGIGLMESVASLFAWVALAAWAATFLGLLLTLMTASRRRAAA
ncbi:MAG: tellurite resistance/C4-dicarboxylate transporter family protein [Trueperaceae bacterium]|nr:tellurite resistance/C4-dicarboxylate transporter family protein [Trueperaceae bacterium]MCO5173613.1 tellurite resistance/C4-dicarboxylate transporter family protein [Trueperaceae bacterium]MCW5819794.1 tellurite resistance/C4-dicarboxylate transporter family protein [Trueperaceae bacterium]